MKRFLLLCYFALGFTTLSFAVAYATVDGIYWRYDSGRILGNYDAGTITSAISRSTEGSVTVPSVLNGETIHTIGDYAFHNCTGVEAIIIPSTIKKIAAQAFYGCSKLTSITIPESVTSIADNAFRGCSNLYKDENDIQYESSAKTVLVKAPTTLVGEFIIPRTVRFIIGEAFKDCKNLTSITLPSSVVSIGGYAFSGCTGLLSVKMSQDVNLNTTASIGRYAFSGCTGLTSVTIPEGVTSIGDYAFCGCSNLKDVVIPESVTSIGSSAFTRTSTSLDGPSKAIFLGKPPSTGKTAGFWGASIYYRKKYVSYWEEFRASAYNGGIAGSSYSSQTRWVCFDDAQVISLFEGGTTEVVSGRYLPGEPTTIKATPAEGYVFLGWSSNVPGISGREDTLTFTLEDDVSLTLIASFFPKALLATWVNEAVEATLESSLDEKVDARIEAKIDGESLLTAEQAATKTSAAIEAKVADGELITSDQLKALALEEPIIEVKEGKATVGISLQKADTPNGDWEDVEDISVELDADEDAAFYRFVVPEKQ